MGLIQRVAQRQVLGLLLAGLLFLFFLPAFVLMMKPHRDLAYHLGDPELQRLEGAAFDGRARTNAYVEISGTIVAATLAERRSIFDRSFGFLFTVDGYPRTLIVHLTEGELFTRLTRAGQKSAASALLEAIKKPVTLRGRLYNGDNILEPFEEYALRDEADPGAYVREILDDRIDTTPDLITRLDGGEPDPRRWWLLAVGEEPAPGHLWETHLPVFGVGILMGLAAIIGLMVVLGRRSPPRPPAPPPAWPTAT